MAKTKFFRVAVEGATTDGRVIERAWIEQMAATYNRTTYAARVNLEHIRGYTADAPFNALGDVLSLKAEEITLSIGGKDEKRLALYAEIDALDHLVAMNKAKQKLFTSVEINPNFAGTGKAYLMGLAVTDSPASLGTELLQFAAQNPAANPFTTRKQDPGNLVTAAEEATLEFTDDAMASPSMVAAITAALGSMFGLNKDLAQANDTNADPATAASAPAQDSKPAEVTATTTATASADPAQFAAFGALVTSFAATFDTFAAEQAATNKALTDQLAALKSVQDNTPANFTQRPPSTGPADAMDGVI